MYPGLICPAPFCKKADEDPFALEAATCEPAVMAFARLDVCEAADGAKASSPRKAREQASPVRCAIMGHGTCFQSQRTTCRLSIAVP